MSTGIKKIPLDSLQLGMYIHDLNIGWMAHHFLRNRFMLKREADLQTLRESGLTELYIDTLKGLDVPGAPTLEEAESQRWQDLTDSLRQEEPLRPSEAAEAEFSLARTLHQDALDTIGHLFGDIRAGRHLRAGPAQDVAKRITDSVVRHHGVFVSLCRLKERDDYTFQHSVSVSALLSLFAHGMGMSEETVHHAGFGGLLHDTGKMTIPDEILNKPDKLTHREYEVMKGHVPSGSAILEATPGIPELAYRVAVEHHERVAGNGYPHSLTGNRISPIGRMAAIADVYDALTSRRVYHSGLQPSDALARMLEWSRTHFDQELVQQFIRFIGIYPVGSLVRLDSECLAIVLDQSETSLLTPVVQTIFDIRRGSTMSPRRIDLSAPESGGDFILSWEDPESWGLDSMALHP